MMPNESDLLTLFVDSLYIFHDREAVVQPVTLTMAQFQETVTSARPVPVTDQVHSCM